MKKWLIGLGTAALLLGLTAVGASYYTHDRMGQLPAALDNVNPLVTGDTVYASTNLKPVRHFTGGGGEPEYEYHVTTVNAKGEKRKVEFLSQWQLKPNRYLAINIKGQNVESWQSVAVKQIPSGAWQALS